MGIGMLVHSKRFAHLDLAIQFFPDFASKALLERFILLDFSTREFPHPAQQAHWMGVWPVRLARPAGSPLL